jgi:DNA-3-methyladenine glycosylase
VTGQLPEPWEQEQGLPAWDQLLGDVATVAPLLLGAVLRSHSSAGAVAVRLTEVEAYGGETDPGSHACRGRTARNASMFGPPGRLYMYFTYGMHWCANVVTGPPGAAGAVLMRAGQVIEGLELAQSRRPAARRDIDLARGPARLASCLGLTGEHDNVSLLGGAAELRLADPDGPGPHVRAGPRVGVSGPGGDGGHFPWRYWLAGDPTVSRYRPARLRG